MMLGLVAVTKAATPKLFFFRDFSDLKIEAANDFLDKRQPLPHSRCLGIRYL